VILKEKKYYYKLKNIYNKGPEKLHTSNPLKDKIKKNESI
jgi:hypothetical protein